MKTVVMLAALGLLGFGSATAKVVNKVVTYEHDGVVLEGYLAWDDTLEGARPGVLVVHQWMGLSDNERMRADMQAGLAQLKSQSGVDPGRLAVIGYCFGGKGALELARSGADVVGAVSFHGNLDTGLPAAAGDIKGKLLVCHGAVDPYVKPEAVHAFLEEMEAARVDYQLIMYAGAVHAFTQKGAGDDPSQGAAYNEAADRRSWLAMKDFFAEIF